MWAWGAARRRYDTVADEADATVETEADE